MKVYILSTYDEHGAENVKASLDKEKMIAHIKGTDMTVDEMQVAMNAITEDEIISTNGLNLGSGWGGYQLHIVELIS